MANHGSIRAGRTPWTVWKGKEVRHHGLDKLCFLVAGKSKMEELADSVYGKSPLPRWPSICWKPTWGKRQGNVLDCRKGTNPLMGAVSALTHFPSHALGVRFQIHKFWRDIHVRILTTCMYVCAWVKLLQPCLTLCDPTDCSPPGSSVRGILQARILERAAISSSRSFQPRDWTQLSCASCTGRWALSPCTAWEASLYHPFGVCGGTSVLTPVKHWVVPSRFWKVTMIWTLSLGDLQWTSRHATCTVSIR